MPAQSGLILGIESSCDETAAAIVRRGTEVLSNAIASQAALHAPHGGVVPELASREHLRAVIPVTRAALAEANITLADLDAVAVTEGPGLAGALLVGILYAKSLAFALGKPLLAVNHLEGHIHAVLMQAPTEPPPLLALVVSGGHTHLYLIALDPDQQLRYTNVGSTVDDAAGEAFDKVAKLLGLPYPGGPAIDALAPYGNPLAVPFHFHPIKPRPNAGTVRFDFSFSGTKSAVARYVHAQPQLAPGIAARAAWPNPDLAALLAACEPPILDLLASFQAAVTGILVRQTLAAARHFGVNALLVSGGVAANRELRRRFTAAAPIPVRFPTISLSTDNAAMIAAAAWPKFLARDFAPDTLAASPQLRLG